MMNFMREWILSIVCGAMILSVLQVVAPKNAVGTVGKIAGGLMMLWLIVQPLMGLDTEKLADLLAERDLVFQKNEAELTEIHHESLEMIIESEIEAYIQDKAISMGIECEVNAVYEWRSEEEPVPISVEVISADPAEAKAQVSSLIEEMLGISAEKQIYTKVVE